MDRNDTVQRPEQSQLDRLEPKSPGTSRPDGQPQSTTSEPAYSGTQGQRQPAQDGERPDGAGQEYPDERRPADFQPTEGSQTFPGQDPDQGRTPQQDDPAARPNR